MHVGLLSYFHNPPNSAYVIFIFCMPIHTADLGLQSHPKDLNEKEIYSLTVFSLKNNNKQQQQKIPQFRQWACQKWPYSTKALLSGIFRWTYLTPNCLRKDGADWKLDPKTVRYWEAGEGREALAKRHTTLSPPEWFLHQNRQQWMSFQCFVQCVGQSQKTASINDNFSRGSRTEAWALFAAILNAGVTLVVTV